MRHRSIHTPILYTVQFIHTSVVRHNLLNNTIVIHCSIRENMTGLSSSTYRVAVSQHEPEWFDLKKSVAKTCRIIAEAAENGAQLVTFAEAFIPGYPAWIW